MRRILPVLALLVVGGVAGAQSSTLYVNDGYGPHGYMIQSGTVTNTFGGVGSNSGDYPLAVGTTIRTFGLGQGYVGNEYDLNGSPTGATYPNNSGNCCFYDGTTDGTYNYTVNLNGTVYRAGLDWSGLTPMFSVGRELIGITYDSGNNSLWLGQYTGSSSNTIWDYALDGTLLSSFAPNVGGNGITALAYNPNDQTLWFSNYDPSASMFQFDRKGTRLATELVSGTYTGYLLAGEFAEVTATPEPASVALLGTGLIAVAGMVIRRRRA